MSVVQAALARAGFVTFAEALEASAYAATLDDGGPYTIFAPNEAAFAKFAHEGIGRLLRGEPALLRAVVGYHIAAGKVLSPRFAGKRIRAMTQAGEDLIIDGKAGLRVNGANVVEPDIMIGACVVHGIDAVLWPSEPAAAVS